MTIVYKNDEKREMTAAVMIPNYEDCDYKRGEKKFTEEEIADFAHDYLGDFRIVDKQHEFFGSGEEVATPIESWLLEKDTEFSLLDGSKKTYPKGTWMLKSRINDDDTWEKVEKGEYTGYSVTVVNEDLANQIKKVAAKSRTLIKDIPNPKAVTVAIVDKPCVKDATFCSMKGTSREESYEGKRDLLRSELRKQVPDQDCYIELTFDDKIIVHFYDQNAYFEIPYKIDKNEFITFGDPVEVKTEYVAKKFIELISKEESFSDKIKKALNKIKPNSQLKNINDSEAVKMTNEEDKKDKEYVTKADLDARFEEHEKSIVAAVKEATETDETKKKKRIAELKKQQKANAAEIKKLEGDGSSSSTKSNEDDPDNEDDEEILGSSKSLDNHDDGNKSAKKSDDAKIMAAMNRTRTGAPKKQ